MGLEQLFYELAGGNLILLAGLGGLFTSLLNMLGALPIFVLRGAESRLPDLGLGLRRA